MEDQQPKSNILSHGTLFSSVPGAKDFGEWFSKLDESLNKAIPSSWSDDDSSKLAEFNRDQQELRRLQEELFRYQAKLRGES